MCQVGCLRTLFQVRQIGNERLRELVTEMEEWDWFWQYSYFLVEFGLLLAFEDLQLVDLEVPCLLLLRALG